MKSFIYLLGTPQFFLAVDGLALYPKDLQYLLRTQSENLRGYGIWIEFFRMSSNLISTIAHSKMQTKALIFPYAFGGVMVVIGTYAASFSPNYKLLIPMVLIIGGFLTFLPMFQ